jgi:hypothetical protein
LHFPGLARRILKSSNLETHNVTIAEPSVDKLHVRKISPAMQCGFDCLPLDVSRSAFLGKQCIMIHILNPVPNLLSPRTIHRDYYHHDHHHHHHDHHNLHHAGLFKSQRRHTIFFLICKLVTVFDLYLFWFCSHSSMKGN